MTDSQRQRLDRKKKRLAEMEKSVRDCMRQLEGREAEIEQNGAKPGAGVDIREEAGAQGAELTDSRSASARRSRSSPPTSRRFRVS